jgi:multicomponent Na+:H+ antiporter subunit D
MLLGVGVGLAVLGDQQMLTAYGKAAIIGGLFHLGNYALYKGLLFLTAGVVFYRTGTRNLNRMGGLGHSMKWTMLCFIIGALAIAGIPPFNGFASKLIIYESVYRFHPLLAVIAMVVSVLTLASFVEVFHSMFMGPRLPQFAETREAPPLMLGAMGVLAVAIVLLGLFPQTAVQWLIEPAAEALVNRHGYIGSLLAGN